MVRFLTPVVLAAALALGAAGSASAQGAITARLEPIGGSAVGGSLTVEPPVGGISTLIVEPTGLNPNARYEASLYAGTVAQPSASAARLMGLLTVGADGRGRQMSAHAVANGVAFGLTRELLADGDHVVLVREQGGPVVAGGAIPRAAAPTQLPRTGGVPALAVAWLGVVALLGAAALLPRRTAGAR